jgi:hypothetical protein
MISLVEFVLAVAVATPQAVPQDAAKGADSPDPRTASALSDSEQKALNRLAKAWFEAWTELVNEDRNPANARKKERRAKEAFLKEWEKREKKEPLKHVGDLVAIFDGAFAYGSQTGTGEIKTIKPKDKGIADYQAVIPRNYRPENKYPTLALIAGWDAGRNQWTDPKDYHAATWKDDAFGQQALCYLPKLDNNLDLDPVPKLGDTQGEATERARIGGLLAPFGDFQRLYHVDRDRVIMDCGIGASGFGLRLASYFPDRFAGLVLRAPVAPEGIRLDSLCGMPVLLISTADTKAACDKLAEALNAMEKERCTVIEAQEAYPFTALAPEIAKWAEGIRRDLFRSRVVIAPNHNLFKKGYWLEIGRADILDTSAPPETRPYIEAVADRAANRIAVTARGVGDFRMLLNDALLDLDKEFTIVVNGKAITEKRERSFVTLTDLLYNRFDPSYVWTCEYATAVPKTDGESDGK